MKQHAELTDKANARLHFCVFLSHLLLQIAIAIFDHYNSASLVR